MKTLAIGLLATGLVAGVAVYGLAGSRDQPSGPPGPSGRESSERPSADRGQREFHVLPPGAKEALKLTTDQVQRIAELDKDVQARLSKILTTEQQDQWNKAAPPARRGDRDVPPADGSRGNAGARGNVSPQSGTDTRRGPPSESPRGADGTSRGGPAGVDRTGSPTGRRGDREASAADSSRASNSARGDGNAGARGNVSPQSGTDTRRGPPSESPRGADGTSRGGPAGVDRTGSPTGRRGDREASAADSSRASNSGERRSKCRCAWKCQSAERHGYSSRSAKRKSTRC